MAEEFGDYKHTCVTTISEVVEQALADILAIRREIRQVTEEEEECSKTIIYKSIIDAVTSHLSQIKTTVLKVLFGADLITVVT